MKKFNAHTDPVLDKRIMAVVRRWNINKPNLYMTHAERFIKFTSTLGNPHWVYEQLIHRFCEAEC